MINKSGGCLGIIITLMLLYFVSQYLSGYGKYDDQTAEEWFNKYDQAEADYESYKSALEEANSQIEKANSMIKNAKSCSWGCDYEEMQNSLNDLKMLDTIDNP